MNGAGGFSGGGSEDTTVFGANGLGCIQTTKWETIGSGYYTKGQCMAFDRFGLGCVGGQGGVAFYPYEQWLTDKSGDGGIAGNGGTITYKNQRNIFAYNGDMITDKNYSAVYKEYNQDGSQTSNVLLPILDKKNQYMIPSKIFCQARSM